MKLRELGQWVGLNGTTLRRRAKSLGFEFNLEDHLDIGTANKLYRELPVEKIMTISYQDLRKPKVEFVGPWNLNDWHRLFKRIQHEIMIRNRDFIRAARKNGQLVPNDAQGPLSREPVENTSTVERIPLVAEPQDQSTSEGVVSNLEALVTADAEPIDQERSDARPENSTRPGTFAAIPRYAEPSGEPAGRLHAPRVNARPIGQPSDPELATADAGSNAGPG